ncbi:hypothetical protein [Paenibacillus montanisoli]|uniref:Uncharacterized protein n=1 Tax=Paenibacillus montanisoli TaxID=2081970 RepID=A0A328U451_9BACL|nr:hypothetical protein [Paenibacillus montanisoli]RAP77400.1 hypothetical protein DL346_02635 [Paenibacillus montanisoli]
MIASVQLRQALRVFLNKAEAAWFEVFDSGINRKVIKIGGREFIQLPLRFSTRAKIYAFFRKFWGITLSRLLLCNLKTIVFKGRVYVVVGDPGTVASVVQTVRILSMTSTRIRVRAILSGDPGGNRTIFYTIARTSCGYKIIARSKNPSDYRFLLCKLQLPPKKKEAIPVAIHMAMGQPLFN